MQMFGLQFVVCPHLIRRLILILYNPIFLPVEKIMKCKVMFLMGQNINSYKLFFFFTGSVTKHICKLNNGI